MHAVHAQSHLLTTTNAGETPTFTWSGHLPDTAHLRPPKSAASVDVVQRNTRGALEAATAERGLPTLWANGMSVWWANEKSNTTY